LKSGKSHIIKSLSNSSKLIKTEKELKQEETMRKMFSSVKNIGFEDFSSNPIWRKFEYFNFNFDPNSEFFVCLN